MNTKQTIACDNVKKSFINGEKRIEVLHSVNLAGYENEMIMLMGPSGSGKTTLISIIGGILEPSSGACTVLHENINTLPNEQKTAFRGKNVGFLFQHFVLIPTLTATENVAIPLLCTGTPREDAFTQARELLASVGLKNHYQKTPGQLSGGEQQRVALARACIHHPKVLLCDEPTSFLDYERGKKIMALLQEIKQKYHSTIIVVTHDHRILHFADRIVEIEDGVIKERKNHTPHNESQNNE